MHYRVSRVSGDRYEEKKTLYKCDLSAPLDAGPPPPPPPSSSSSSLNFMCSLAQMSSGIKQIFNLANMNVELQYSRTITFSQGMVATYFRGGGSLNCSFHCC